MLLVLDFANVITEVVKPSVSEPAHQSAKDAAEDHGGDQDSGESLDPEVVCLCWARG
jgi:hypothetical protein